MLTQGDTLGTMRHGRGTFTSATGDTYTGGWQYNKRQGKGHAKFIRRTSAETSEQPLPVSYEGDWEDDRTQGYAVHRLGSSHLAWGMTGHMTSVPCFGSTVHIAATIICLLQL